MFCKLSPACATPGQVHRHSRSASVQHHPHEHIHAGTPTRSPPGQGACTSITNYYRPEAAAHTTHIHFQVSLCLVAWAAPESHRHIQQEQARPHPTRCHPSYFNSKKVFFPSLINALQHFVLPASSSKCQESDSSKIANLDSKNTRGFGKIFFRLVIPGPSMSLPRFQSFPCNEDARKCTPR